MAKSYYEFTDDKSSKFWEIDINGETVTVRFGKIGTEGQTKVKKWDSPAEAQAHAVKVTAEKTKKGYRKAKRPVASKVKAKASGLKNKASGKQQAAKRPTNKAKANKPVSHGPAPTSQAELVAWLKEPGRSGAELASAAGRFTGTDRLIATHGDAPPALLAKLSHSKDRSTRARVAANPNIPVADYVRLGQQFPKEFLANPLLDLLLLEDPAWAQQLPEGLLAQVLKREGCPADFLVWASSHSSEKVQLAVAMNAKAPEAALAQLRRSKHKKVRESIPEGAVDDPEEQFREAVRERLAALTPDEALDAWQRHDIGLAQFAVLSHPSKKAVAGLIDRYSHAVRQALAGNPATPETVLDGELARDVRREVRLAVANNPAAPRRTLRRLERDDDASIHWAARTGRSLLKPKAKKGNGPLKSRTRQELEAQAKSPDVQARIELAKDPETPTDILETLARREFAEQGRRLELLEKPLDLPWFVTHVSKSSTELRNAVKYGNYLYYCGKDPSKAVLSRRPIAMVLALASGPFVTPDRIARVSGSSDWLVRAAVARNTGTPAGLRAKLQRDAHPLVRALASASGKSSTPGKTAESSDGFDARRVSSEMAKLLRDRPGRDRRTWLAQADGCPPRLLEFLAKDEDPQVRASVVGDRIPVALLEGLAKDKSPMVRETVARSKKTPPESLMVLVRDRSENVRSWAAGNRNMPAAGLAVLARDSSTSVRAAVANHENTPKQVLEDLSVDVDGWVRKNACKRVRTPKHRLEGLAGDDDVTTRRSVAENPYASAAVLERLAGDKQESVRAAVAAHQNAPMAVLERLATDKKDPVRAAVAGNPRLPGAAQERLANDTDRYVQRCVAGNPAAPPHVLEALAKGEYYFVVAENPNCPAPLRDALWRKLATNPDFRWRRQLVRNSMAPVSALEIFAKDIWESIRRGVAEHENVTVELLGTLAKDRDSSVRDGVARHPRTPQAVLAVLANDDDERVRQTVAKRLGKAEALPKDEDEAVTPDLSWKEAAGLLGIEPLPTLPEPSIIRWLELLVGFPEKPDNKALTKASRDKNWFLRLGVALHPDATDAMLELLAADANADVAGVARQKLALRRNGS